MLSVSNLTTTDLIYQLAHPKNTEWVYITSAKPIHTVLHVRTHQINLSSMHKDKAKMKQPSPDSLQALALLSIDFEQTQYHV